MPVAGGLHVVSMSLVLHSWWRHQMETFSEKLAICAGNSPVPVRPGLSRRTLGGNGRKFCMLMYLDHLQNWLVYVHGLLICLTLVLFWLSEASQIWVFRAFRGKPIGETAWHLYADVSWSPSELIFLYYGHSLLIFLALFGLGETGLNSGFQAFWVCADDFPHYYNCIMNSKISILMSIQISSQQNCHTSEYHFSLSLKCAQLYFLY